ncbi:beta-ketoacyl-[acyl-carrier-protein] synthase family protein [Lentisphaerota bacterium WC36G]|nr:beta-ketoacyl-[acyl-carrier-protein] synthase family protein [Lentisphaerae bacterium WC36]
MHKVVVTGRGVVSPIGKNLQENKDSLYSGKSGLSFIEHWNEIELQSQVAGFVQDKKFDCPLIDKKTKRFSSANAIMAIVAAYEAIQEAGLGLDELRNINAAVINGCASSGYTEIHKSAQKYLETKKMRSVSPFVVPRVMPSSAVANLSIVLGITGESYDISAACASSSMALVTASRMIQAGLYDIVVVGGSEELNWVQTLGFDAMRALSTQYNDKPEKSSRPFDQSRDGFVIAEGAGVMILESEEHAKKRGAKIVACLTSAVANSNATDMVVPDAKTNIKLMTKALDEANLTAKDIDYINTHGTATPIGDPVELESIRETFGDETAFNSTKSQTGHMIGATGIVEAIFTTIMMENNFISPTLNLQQLEEGYENMNAISQTTKKEINHALCNSFAFGGSNSCLVFSKPND